MPITTVYLIRHAHAVFSNDEARSLSPSGREAAQVVANRLATAPLAAIYSSPSTRVIDTVLPLAERLALEPQLVPDLRERELPIVRPDEFEGLVRDAWQSPDQAPHGGESNVRARARGLAVVRGVVSNHAGQQAALATHGNLLTLVLNALDSAFGYEFWRRLSFPDIYRLDFDNQRLARVERTWDAV